MKALKQWGRKLDSVNKWMYHNKDTDSTTKSAQVHELTATASQRSNKPEGRVWKPPETSGKANWKQNREFSKPFVSEKAKAEKSEAQQGSSQGSLDRRIATYRVPDKLVCFNCRGKYHHHKACLLKKKRVLHSLRLPRFRDG